MGGRKGAGISTHAPPAPGLEVPVVGGDPPGLLLLPPPVPLRPRRHHQLHLGLHPRTGPAEARPRRLTHLRPTGGVCVWGGGVAGQPRGGGGPRMRGGSSRRREAAGRGGVTSAADCCCRRRRQTPSGTRRRRRRVRAGPAHRACAQLSHPRGARACGRSAVCVERATWAEGEGKGGRPSGVLGRRKVGRARRKIKNN